MADRNLMGMKKKFKFKGDVEKQENPCKLNGKGSMTHTDQILFSREKIPLFC